ncbi:MAG: GspE/PulE family protein [Verrucomicrobiota bacterium]|nr:GspE/PulE family protein [Verrucomicrobiota bacterium]
MSEKKHTEVNTEKEKTSNFIELLHQDVSWDSIHSVLNYEIPPVFSKKSADLADIALRAGWISEEDLEELRYNKDLVGEAVGRVLVEKGLITKAQLEKAKSVKEKSGQPLWRTLVHLGITLPQEIGEVLTTPIELSFATIPKNKYFKYLLDNKIVSEEKLNQLHKESKNDYPDFSRYLLETETITSEEHAKALSAEHNIPFDPLENDEIPLDVIEKLPSFFIRKHNALPYKIEENQLFVAFADTTQIRALEKLGLMLDINISSVISPEERLTKLMDNYIPEENIGLAVGSGEIVSSSDMESVTMPTIEMVSAIIRGLINSRGTDIHIDSQKNSSRVRYRVDGILHDVMTLESDIKRKVVSRIKTLSGMDIAQQLLPQDGHLSIEVGGEENNFRVSSLPTSKGEKLVLRLVGSEMAFAAFERLGMSVEQRKLMDKMLNISNGLVLTSGPVGNGKTTTLYSSLNCIDFFSHNIMTIEDPVEYDVPGANQIQVNTRSGLSFATGLRSILRQDPDVIMIGEIRDEETATIAVRAAMTGELVLSTLHANNAPTAITSLIQLGVKPYLIANAIAGVIFQRLARKICTHCKYSYKADEADIKELGIEKKGEILFYKGKGCVKCLHTGYLGRTGLFEIFIADASFREVLVSEPTKSELIEASEKAGMLSLRDHAIEKLLNGETTKEEIMRII